MPSWLDSKQWIMAENVDGINTETAAFPIAVSSVFYINRTSLWKATQTSSFLKNLAVNSYTTKDVTYYTDSSRDVEKYLIFIIGRL